MESSNEVKPQLDEQGVFWESIQAKCLQGIASVHWSISESQWFPQLCKFHVYQSLLCKAVNTLKGVDCDDMKRKHGDEQPERYIFVVDAVVKHHQFSKEEIKFLKQINLDGFVARVSWGVLHEALVREAVVNLEETTMNTTVQGKQFPLLQADWRAQLQDTFKLTTRKVAAIKQWEMTEFFPSLKTAADGQESVKVTDCAYPGAKKPLRMLSSLFCLNTTSQNHISISFAEVILAALNGHAIDWAQEFYQEFHDEIVKLHRKHLRTTIKVERTTIGPHLTLILKAARVMNIREETEAGFYKDRTDDDDHPKRRKCTDAPLPSKPPPSLHSKFRVVQPRVVQFQETAPNLSTKDASTSTIFETEEPWQVPDDVPHLVQQITQAHRRLENLLTTLTSRAPPKLMRNVDHQFHKVQREATMKEECRPVRDPTKAADMVKSLVFQIERLEEKLASKEELIDLYIENSFETQTQLAEKEEEAKRLKTELQTVTQRDQEELFKLQKQERTHMQQMEAKEKEVANLKHQVRERTEEVATYKQKIKELHKTYQQEKEELTRLRAENEERITVSAKREHNPTFKDGSRSNQPPPRPIDRTERQALTTGAAEQLLSDLQQELEASKQQNEELQHQLHKEVPLGQMDLPPSFLHPKAEIYRKLLNHTEPLNSVMQYYQAYGALDLLTSGLPLPKKGIRLTLIQFQRLWETANSKAKDTLTFMWALNEIKLSLGTIEIVAGSPPFFIRRFMLRSVAFIAQQRGMHAKGQGFIPPLPTLRPYTHSQRIEITKLVHNHQTIFRQATDALKKEDTAICFEAVRRHQWLIEHHPDQSIKISLPLLKTYVTETLEEQQMTITKGQFGAINNGTILRIPVPDQSESIHSVDYEA